MSKNGKCDSGFVMLVATVLICWLVPAPVVITASVLGVVSIFGFFLVQGANEKRRNPSRLEAMSLKPFDGVR